MKQLLLALATPLIFLLASVSAEEKPLNKYTEHELRMLISAQAQYAGEDLTIKGKMDKSMAKEKYSRLDLALDELVRRKVLTKKTLVLFTFTKGTDYEAQLEKLSKFIELKSTTWGRFTYSEMMDWGHAKNLRYYNEGDEFKIAPRIPKSDLEQLEKLFFNNTKQQQIERAWQATTVACENSYAKIRQKELVEGNKTSYIPIKESIDLDKFKTLDESIADLVKLGELHKTKIKLLPQFKDKSIQTDEVHKFFYKLEQKYGVYLSQELQGRGVRQRLKAENNELGLITIYLTEEDTKTYLKFLKAAGLIK